MTRLGFHDRLIGGRYALLDAFASGGMATVHFGRQIGPAGIERLVAMKRLHPHLSRDPEFSAMFLDEARMATRIRHPNVVPVLDVLLDRGELFLVMEYVAGLPLSSLFGSRQRRWRTPLPAPITSALVGGALLGLQAAHEATNATGEPLGLVHRDISPQNVLVGADGIARLIDFGVAKAAGRLQVTTGANVKGKVAYMAPEQLASGPVSARSDVYAIAVVLWECLTGRGLLASEDAAAVEQSMLGDFDPPSRWTPALPAVADEVVMKGLAHDPRDRWASAREMAIALEAALPRASPPEVTAWLGQCAREALAEQEMRARSAEATRRGAAPVSSRSSVAAFAGALVCAAGLGVAGWTVARSRSADGARAGAGGFSPPGASASAIDAHASASLAADLTRPDRVGPAWPHESVVPAPRATSVRLATLVPSIAPAPSVTPLPPAAPQPAYFDEDPCRVPYVIDPQGHRRYIRACLR